MQRSDIEIEEGDRVAVEIQAILQGSQPFDVPSVTFLITKACTDFKTATLICLFLKVIAR